jgi:hypothetical protein
MTSEEVKIELSKTKNDLIASALKASLSTIPCAGPLIAEIAGEIIPNQRVDRIVGFVEILDTRLSNLEEEFVKSQIDNEYFTDLIEEGIRQASRAISKERKDYIASIIAKSLSSDDVNYIESKHLMRILRELNDIEIIWLKSFSIHSTKTHQKFKKKHKDILFDKRFENESSKIKADQVALQQSYKEHLTQFSLLKPVFEQSIKGRNEHVPQFDNSTGEQIKTGYQITDLGYFLLKTIDLYNPKNLE